MHSKAAALTERGAPVRAHADSFLSDLFVWLTVTFALLVIGCRCLYGELFKPAAVVLGLGCFSLCAEAAYFAKAMIARIASQDAERRKELDSRCPVDDGR